MKSERFLDQDKVDYYQNLPTELENNLTKGKADEKKELGYSARNLPRGSQSLTENVIVQFLKFYDQPTPPPPPPPPPPKNQTTKQNKKRSRNPDSFYHSSLSNKVSSSPQDCYPLLT